MKSTNSVGTTRLILSSLWPGEPFPTLLAFSIIAPEVFYVPPSTEGQPWKKNQRALRVLSSSNPKPNHAWHWPETQKAPAAFASLLLIGLQLCCAGPWDADGARRALPFPGGRSWLLSRPC